MQTKYNVYSGVTRIKSTARKLTNRFTFGIAAGVSALGLAIIPMAAATSSTTVVTTANPQGWVFFDDNGAGGSGSFVDGPGTPPAGSGSAQISATQTQGYALGYAGYGATQLADITNLSYSTYNQTGNNTVALALQLNFDTDTTDTNTAWQGRLIYEPYYTHTVTDGMWQAWNTQDNATSGTLGNWWFSNAGIATNSGCTQATPCTWQDVISKYPNGGINGGTNQGIDFKAGSNWSTTFVGNVDAFTIGISGNTTTYDFEAQVAPVAVSDKDACKNGGWSTQVDANGHGFKNQGACVSYVASNGKSQH
jgi:hypothetical protein